MYVYYFVALYCSCNCFSKTFFLNKHSECHCSSICNYTRSMKRLPHSAGTVSVGHLTHHLPPSLRLVGPPMTIVGPPRRHCWSSQAFAFWDRWLNGVCDHVSNLKWATFLKLSLLNQRIDLNYAFSNIEWWIHFSKTHSTLSHWRSRALSKC